MKMCVTDQTKSIKMASCISIPKVMDFCLCAIVNARYENGFFERAKTVLK